MSAISSICPDCGTELPASARFCPACGAPAAGAAPGEERKVITVLFADLVDSTAHAERLDPEDLRGILSPYFARLRTELERYGGTVEKFIGDAVMALFGAPVAHEDDPERAVRAALAIRDAIGDLNEETPDFDLHVRVAVNTGEAVVALGARPAAGEGMAAGDVVNTCFRLQAAAPVDGILVGETTYRATVSAIEYRPLDHVVAKGKAEPVPVWEAIQPRDEREGLLTSAPLVGRWHELNLLLDALVRARAERTPQLVTLVGVPGIGKTRLVRELLIAVDQQPEFVSWRHGRCLPYGDGIAFAALADMVKSEAGILASDAAAAAEAKLHESVTSVVTGEAEVQWLERHLRPLIGLEGERTVRGDRREDAFAAWRRFFEAVAQRDPLVLVFEDLHWADVGLLDFIDYLVDWASGVPLLVLCTTRPELLERRSAWGGGKRNAATISLSPLSNQQTAELVQALLADVVLPEELAGPLLANAGGNALYAEEYARILADRGLLWRYGELAAADLPLPESIQGIIAARIDALPAEEKALLQQAAVIGKGFWLGAVTATAGIDRADAERRLHALERKEFVQRDQRSSVAGELQYAFRHILVRDVAYAQIPRAGRTRSHLAAATWIESLAADREEHAELLAHHYASALSFARAVGQEADELRDRAARALEEAGHRALALHAFERAVTYYRQAFELDGADAQRPDLLLCYGKALVHAEGAGADLLAQAAAELVERGERDSAAEAEALQAILASRQGALEQATEHINRAEELIADAPPSEATAQVLATLAGLVMTADPGEATRLGGEALALAEQLGLESCRASALTTIGFARATSGEDGVAELERAIAVAAAANSPEIVRAQSMLAAVLADQGELVRSAEIRSDASEAATRIGNPTVMRFLDAERVADAYWAGRWEEATQVADEMIREAEAGSPHYGEMLCRQIRAEIRLGRGDMEGALEDAAKSLEAARRTTHPQALFPALAVEARALSSAGRTDEATRLLEELLAGWGRTPASFWMADLAVVMESFGRTIELEEIAARARVRTRWLEAAVVFVRDPLGAADLYSRIGTRPDEAFARVRGAEALLVTGQRERAEDELTAAKAFYRSVGAEAYLQQADAAFAAS